MKWPFKEKIPNIKWHSLLPKSEYSRAGYNAFSFKTDGDCVYMLEEARKIWLDNGMAKDEIKRIKKENPSPQGIVM